MPSSKKKIDQYRDFAAGVYLSLVQNPIPPSLPHCLVYVCTVYLFTQGRGGGVEIEPERRLERQKFTKLGRKYQHDWLYLQSLNSDKHPPQSPFTGSIFLDDVILLWRLYLISPWMKPRKPILNVVVSIWFLFVYLHVDGLSSEEKNTRVTGAANAL